MHIVRLTISGFRGVQSADITLGRHSVLVGPNNSGKTTITEALALLFGRDRLVRRLTEHDFYGSAPEATTRILIMATVTGFPNNDPQQNTSWFAIERGVEKWLDPKAKTIIAEPNAKHTELAVEIGFAARFDLDELEAEMFPPADTLFIETSSGTLTAKPLMKTMPAAPTNHQQHLLYAWREKLVASLMHECVLIPEGVSDVAWLEALQTALELQQGWTETQGNSSRFATFVGVVPTIDAKIADTFTLINQVHARPCILVDGDPDGRGYFDAVKVLAPPPKCVLFWQQGRSIEHVMAWIAAADEVNVLAALGSSLGHNFATAAELVTFLLGQKSYAPTHESASVTLMGNRACRTRATQLLGAMCDLLHAPASATSNLFQRVSADSTSTMHVFRFSP